MDNPPAEFQELCSQAEKAVEAYVRRWTSVREALEQRIKHDSEVCERVKQRLEEVEVECKLKERACARSKEQLEATQQELQSLVKDLENLKVRESSAVDSLKEFDKEAYDSNVKMLSKQKRLASKIMKLELEQCSETEDLKGVVHHDDGKSEPFCVATSGRDPCDIADDLWNLVPL
ncbi:hypothetical protein V5799_011916 [Amblyomma americanum]|uniref:Uncharacterized protein n=1 Tax=Amblyomma americanum TaxID=6943 RepID=A0AAQ4EFW6_AMBAM